VLLLHQTILSQGCGTKIVFNSAYTSTARSHLQLWNFKLQIKLWKLSAYFHWSSLKNEDYLFYAKQVKVTVTLLTASIQISVLPQIVLALW